MGRCGCIFGFFFDGFGRVTAVSVGGNDIVRAAYMDGGNNIDGVSGAAKKVVTAKIANEKSVYSTVCGQAICGRATCGTSSANTVIDEESVVTASYYDKYGQLIKVRQANSADTGFKFTDDYDCITVTDTSENGIRIVTYATSGTEYRYYYDLITDRVLAAEQWRGSNISNTFTFEYDKFGRGCKNSFSLSNEDSIEYAYEYKPETDEVSKVTITDMHIDNQASSVLQFSSEITTDKFGRINTYELSTSPDKKLIKQVYRYKQNSPIVESISCYKSTEADSGSAYETLGVLNYTYDANNNIIEVKDDEGTRKASYEYDGLNRIIKEVTENGNAVYYEYDGRGNIARKTAWRYKDFSGAGKPPSFWLIEPDMYMRVEEFSYSPEDGDRLLTKKTQTHIPAMYIGGQLFVEDKITTDIEEYSYDPHGNQKIRGKNELHWEMGNRLVKVNTVTGSGLLIDKSAGDVVYSYDYRGIRTGKTIRGKYRNTVSSGAEQDGVDEVSYCLNGTQILAEIHSEKISQLLPWNLIRYYYDSVGVCGFGIGDNRYYYIKNLQGDIIKIVGEDGTVYGEYSYDAWGNCTIVTDKSGIATLNPFRYRGYYYDEETGLYYLQTRYYDPTIGRFISPDSVDYLDPESINGLNLYIYCLNNPVMNVDPSGHIILSLIIAAVIGAAASALSSVMSQLLTTGTINWGQVGISALFGAVGGLLSFTGVGGVLGQFLIQGALGVGELYSISALNGTIDSVGIEAVVATFLFAGGVGSLGTGSAAAQFKRIGQIESSFIKYTLRDIKRYAKPILSTIVKRGGKYFKAFIAPTMRQAAISGGVNTIANIFDYWMQKLYEQW